MKLFLLENALKMDDNNSPNLDAAKKRKIKALVVLLCLTLALALVHVNVIGRQFTLKTTDPIAGDPELIIDENIAGWPVICAMGNYFNPRWLLVDIIFCITIVFTTFLCVRSFLVKMWHRKQFSLASIFMLTTIFAVMLSLITLEKTYGWSNLEVTNSLDIGVYSALTAFPLYDIIPISLGLVCCAFVLVSIVLQLAKMTAQNFSRQTDENQES